MVDEIIATGKVARPYLGIRGEQTMDGQAVVSVEEAGPAAAAGLQPGDVITAIDGESFDDESFINRLIFDHEPGDEVTLTVERDGEELTVDVTLGERPAATAVINPRPSHRARPSLPSHFPPAGGRPVSGARRPASLAAARRGWHHHLAVDSETGEDATWPGESDKL